MAESMTENQKALIQSQMLANRSSALGSRLVGVRVEDTENLSK